ncbi:MAG: winged helix-turn-helix transcriptional regulator [Pelomonas sp.]|nr:winged helix-turn-helix transcriptional regulator [Roseateles sp.]
MPKSPRNHLLLAVHQMPMDALDTLMALAAARGWPVRREGRLPPRVRSGEVLVAMAPVWLAMATTADSPPPRGLCLIPTAGKGAQPAVDDCGLAEVVLAWPCDASLLLEPLSRLTAPAPLALDPVSRTVTHRGRLVQLTPRECRVLQVLIAQAGQAVPRDRLEAALHVWGQEFESNTLDVHVHRLRRKLPDAGIRAVRGYGYVLIAQP